MPNTGVLHAVMWVYRVDSWNAVSLPWAAFARARVFAGDSNRLFCHLSREIEIGVPTVDDRRSILLCHLSRLPHSLTPEDVTHAAAVTHGYVPSDIVGLCKEAAMAALRRRSAGGPPPCISSDDIAIALSKTSPSALREVAVDVPKVCVDPVRIRSLRYANCIF